MPPEPEITQEQWDQLKADGPKPPGPLTPATEDGFAPAALSTPKVQAEPLMWLYTAPLMADHPLRTGTTHCEAGCKYGVESKHSDHCNSALGNVIDAPATDSGLVDQLDIQIVGIGFAIAEGCPEKNAYARVGKTVADNADTILTALRSPDRELLREEERAKARLEAGGE